MICIYRANDTESKSVLKQRVFCKNVWTMCQMEKKILALKNTLVSM